MAKRTCTNCKNELGENDLFCQKCGTKVEIKEEKPKSKDSICPSCGNEISKTDAFCMICGAKIESKEEKKEKEETKKKDSKCCPNCGDEVQDGEKFCQKCGTKLDEKEKETKSKPVESKKKAKKCPSCGNEISETDSFCMNCGTKLGEEIVVKEQSKKKPSNKCPNCGDLVQKDEKFCQKCGTKLDEDAPVLVNNYNQPKKKKTGIIVAFIIIFILLITIGILLFVLLSSGDKKESPKDKPKEEQKDKDPKPEPEPAKKKVNIYMQTDNTFTTENKQYSIDVGTIEVVDDNYKIYDGMLLASQDGAIILYKDNNKMVLANTKTQEFKNIDLSVYHDKYSLVGIMYKEAKGVTFYDGVEMSEDSYGYKTLKSFRSSGYYNLETGKELYKGKGYFSFKYLSNDKIMAEDDNYLNENRNIYLLSSNEEYTYLSSKYYVDGQYVTFEALGDNFIVKGTEGIDGIYEGTIYDKNMNVLFESIKLSDVEEYNGYLYVIKDNMITKYDRTGYEVYKSDKFGEILDVIQNYFIVIENNKIVAKNEYGLNVTIGDWKSTYQYHSMISGYYSEGQLSNENEKDAGIYLIVQTDENGYSSGVEYYINPDTHEVKKYELKEIGGYAKPVLYLYPEKETNVTVKFDNENNLTTTYPKYKNEWKVLAKPNGDLYDSNGKYYYGLYWEELPNHKVDFSTGFYVEKEDAIEFLEEKLTKIGLNDKERNEFIMYWLPILEKNEKSLVYFELTNERNTYNKLNINPLPDSILRVAIHVKKVDKKTSIKEEILPTFNRVGFTAVEWGGVVYN